MSKATLIRSPSNGGDGSAILQIDDGNPEFGRRVFDLKPHFLMIRHAKAEGRVVGKSESFLRDTEKVPVKFLIVIFVMIERDRIMSL